MFRKLAVLLTLLFLALPAFAQKLTPEEVIAKHLDAIGTAEKRASLKSLIAVGDVTVKFLSPKRVSPIGRVVLASSGGKNFTGLNLNSSDYPGEKFSFDGKKVKASYIAPGQRSFLGNFIISNGAVLEESLFGGILSTSWTLANLTGKKAKLSFRGTEKINDREVYKLDYSIKGDFDISLFFDKETFQHVRTEYHRVSPAPVGRTIDDSARQSESRLRIIEDFSDFKNESGLMLPHHYRLYYSVLGASSTEVEWSYNLTEFAFNQTMDENTFNADL